MNYRSLFYHGVTSLLFVGPVAAGPDKAPITPPLASEPRINLWEVTIRPYGWLAGIDGTSGVGGFTTDVDVPFETILENLDMIAMVQVDVRRDRWMLLLDGMYLKLSAGGETPGRLLETIDVELEQLMAEAAVGYRLWQGERGFVDVFAGARYMYMGTELSLALDSAGIGSLSEDLSREAVRRITEALAKGVPEAIARAEGRIAGAVLSRIEARVDEVFDNHPNLPKLIEILQGADGPVADAIRTMAQAKLEEKANEASAVAAAVKARIREKVQRAIARAERNLARAIESALTDAIPSEVSGSKQWVDPFVGVRGRFNFTDRLYAVARADVGGFGVGSDLAWQLYAALGWHLTPRTTIELGYRHLYMDYTRGGFVYDISTSGAFVGMGFTF